MSPGAAAPSQATRRPPSIPERARRRPVPSEAIAPAETTDPAPAETSDPGRGTGPGLGVVLGGLAGLWGLLIGIARLSDNSALTHIATGRLILEGRGIPRSDPYSFTAPGEPWVVASWLASVIYGGAEELAGLQGIRLVNAVLCTLLAVGVWVLTSRSPSIVVRLGITFLVLLAGTEMWTERPLLFGLLGLVTALLVADEHLDPRLLVPVGWIWVNTHGSFPLGLAALAVLAVGTRLDRGAWGIERRALGWLGLGVALGAINPLGPRLLLYPLLVGERTEAFRTVAEWQPPRLETLGQHLVVVAMVLAGLGLIRHRRWRYALPLVAFGVLALSAARNGSAFLLVAAPALAAAAPAWGPSVAGFRRPILRPAAVALAALAVVFTASSLSGPQTALDAYPVELAARMEADGLWGPESRVFASDTTGNLRTFTAGTEARTFIDDRVDMYPLAVIRDYRTVAGAEPGWEAVLERRQITAVLWKEDSSLVRALVADGGWEVVDRESLWVVVVRRTSR